MEKELKKAGSYKSSEKLPGTGMLYFFNAKSKNLLSKVTLSSTNEEIREAYQIALRKG